ncbi:hypothetical protein [Zavarzinella formosa]|uniref:hypothetical protein n=1 Tax=Zavarzinella formosa TaxID=360055 RepID=UPI0002DB5E5E|nr:hypothetical protein [Zavarzinella formosa]
MNNKIEEVLLGHLLKANDPATQAEVERLICCNPRTRRSLETLETALAPLAADKDDVAPPRDLWLRTISRVAEHLVATEGPPSQVVEEPPVCGRGAKPRLNGCSLTPSKAVKLANCEITPVTLMPASDPEIRLPRQWNVFATIGLSLAGLALLFPAVIHWRQQNDRMTCQNSMRRFHEAATSYAERREGWLPLIEDGEKVARIVTILDETGSLGPNEHFGCAAAPAPPGNLPFANYSYSLGYRDGTGELRGLHVRADDGSMPLLADAPMRNGECHASLNHPHGQNVLFLGGNVRFCSHVNVGIDQDDIFVNDRGQVGAGLRRLDSVLGRPEERP